MKVMHLPSMTRGWFVGAFEPTALSTPDVEVGVRHYKAGQHEASHFHRVATELTCVISGEVQMFGQRFGPGDIVVVEPGDATDFTAITDAVNVVVKHPGVLNDKFPVPEISVEAK